MRYTLISIRIIYSIQEVSRQKRIGFIHYIYKSFDSKYVTFIIHQPASRRHCSRQTESPVQLCISFDCSVISLTLAAMRLTLLIIYCCPSSLMTSNPIIFRRTSRQFQIYQIMKMICLLLLVHRRSVSHLCAHESEI